ncbi:hypothetical protein [Nonomuraea sp. SYSU D8015]|uniref:hypothetical protein n=1 Tax=Nonomuraea sp. SYSU D8015 TaxID=2593644 RepID=UPI0016604DD2|nr:hypothetical protein [Nonomuraea sp. SYSU D8015]
MPPPPPPPSGAGSAGLLIGLMFVGLIVYSVLNTVIFFFILFASMGAESAGNIYVAAGTTVLALIGLGVGGGLLFMRRPWTKGLGLGLMIGWALWSILSAGICTGLNPELYA